MIRLAAFDIDRTLVSHMNYGVAPETVKALGQLQSRGIKTAISTGRQWQQVPRALKELNFDYYILLNGIHVTDRQGNTLARRTIGMEDARALIEDICGRGRTLHLRFAEGMYPVLERDRKQILAMDTSVWPEEMLGSILTESAMGEGEAPMAALGEILPEEEEAYRQKYPRLDFLRVQGGPNCDIMPKGSSKGVGIETVCRILGLEPGEVIAFGDDLNDLEMIRMAGTGVAMGDALEEVKAVADYVTGTCEELGVVTGLRHFGLID